MLWLLLRSVIISAVRRCDVEADICSQHSAGKEACEHRMEWHEKQRERYRTNKRPVESRFPH